MRPTRYSLSLISLGTPISHESSQFAEQFFVAKTEKYREADPTSLARPRSRRRVSNSHRRFASTRRGVQDFYHLLVADLPKIRVKIPIAPNTS